MIKKSLLLKESRGSIINDLDKAMENGYKVELTYYNEGSGNVITRSLYIFSRGLTSRGKMCYRAFQYDPKSGERGYRSKKNHGWRLFDVENIVNYHILNKRSKLWIKGEIPEWLSKLNVENDKMFKNGTLKYMDLSLFTDKHRGNASIQKRRDAVSAANSTNGEDNTPEPQTNVQQTSLFDEPVNNVTPKRKYTKRRPKQDFTNQSELDFSDDSTEETNVNPNQNNKPFQDPNPIKKEPEKEVENDDPDDDDEIENRDRDVDQVKESIIKKKDLLKWKGKEV